MPYIIAPSSKDDKVGERPEDFEGNMALEVIATDNRYTVFAGPSYKPEVATKVLSIAGLTLSKEAEQYRRRHSQRPTRQRLPLRPRSWARNRHP